jgi:hypothetical protein
MHELIIGVHCAGSNSSLITIYLCEKIKFLKYHFRKQVIVYYNCIFCKTAHTVAQHSLNTGKSVPSESIHN